MTSFDEVIKATIEGIKGKNIPLSQAIQSKNFVRNFFEDFLTLSKKLEGRGLHDFKIRTINGFSTVQPLAIGSALTYQKILNEDFNINKFLLDLGTPRNGYFQFGYLVSSQIDQGLSITDEIGIYPFREVEKQISAINHSEILNFFAHTSPEFVIHRDKLAVLLIKIPLKTMVLEDGSSVVSKN